MSKLVLYVITLTILIFSCGAYATLNANQYTDNNILTTKVTAGVLDRLWDAYHSTNNPIYVKRILVFLAKQNDFMLFVGYEILNRQFTCQTIKQYNIITEHKISHAINEQSRICSKSAIKDLVHAIRQKYPNKFKQKFIHAVTISAAIWSLGSQDKATKTQIKKIISNNPKLDYWHRINTILKK